MTKRNKQRMAADSGRNIRTIGLFEAYGTVVTLRSSVGGSTWVKVTDAGEFDVNGSAGMVTRNRVYRVAAALAEVLEAEGSRLAMSVAVDGVISVDDWTEADALAVFAKVEDACR